jgi:hypothetical protein
MTKAEFVGSLANTLNQTKVSLERRRALEEDDAGASRLGNLKCLQPCLPDLVRILK